MRLRFIAGSLVLVAIGTAIAIAAPRDEEPSDSATQLKILGEEVRRLKLEVADLKKQVAELQAARGQAMLPILQFQPAAMSIPAGQPFRWNPPARIELPSIIVPAQSSYPPQNYDMGLYVFPGFDAPVQNLKDK